MYFADLHMMLQEAEKARLAGRTRRKTHNVVVLDKDVLELACASTGLGTLRGP